MTEPFIPGSQDHLERVQSLTDAALAHLTLEGLLDELLLRVRELLDVDTAAVLLLDPQRQELIATAAKGIEEEVEQGVRIPLGKGFAGTIAASAKPVILASVDHTKVMNPLLLRRGIRSMLGVPMVIGGTVVGVLHVGTLQPRTFTINDVELLQLVADRAALALNVRRDPQHRVTAETLQRSLLPDRFPRVEGIGISGLYVPAGGGMVGGDWYDVFVLPSGPLCIVVGDAVGKGLQAAISMARIRDAVRTLAFVEPSPARVMSHLNQLIRHFDPEMMATAFIGVIAPDGAMTYASAGHLPPVLVDRSGSATFVESGPEPVLSATLHTYSEYEIALPTGSSLIVYTDGLVERRGQPLSDGLERLRAATAHPWHSVEELCGRVLGKELLAATLTDDLAVIVLDLSSPGSANDLRMAFPADPRELAALRQALRRWGAENQMERHDLADFLLATGEAVSNAIEHAYGPGRGSVRLHASLADGVLHVSVSDEGRWRSPRGADRGRGRMMMEATMDDVTLHSGDSGTTVRMRKVLSSGNG